MAVVGGLVTAILIAESAARIGGLGPPVYEPRRFEPSGKVPFIRIPNGPLGYVPNTTFSSVYDPAGDTRGYFDPNGRVTYRINRFGMRGPERAVQKAPSSFRVVCLGDSFTFGEGVKYADTYPAQLEAMLSAAMPDRRVEVLNAGVQAYGTQDAVAFYLLRCARFRPDVVVLGFFVNDVTDREATIRQNDARTQEWNLSAFSRISRLWEIVERRRYAIRLQEEFVQTTLDSFRSKRWDECKEILRGMKQTVAVEDGFRFIVMMFPALWGSNGDYPFEEIHQTVAAACREADIEFIDLLEVYRGHRPESLWVHPTDQHPNERAYRAAAERLSRRLMGRTRVGA